jgi:hypothetical protein
MVAVNFLRVGTAGHFVVRPQKTMPVLSGARLRMKRMLSAGVLPRNLTLRQTVRILGRFLQHAPKACARWHCAAADERARTRADVVRRLCQRFAAHVR